MNVRLSAGLVLLVLLVLPAGCTSSGTHGGSGYGPFCVLCRDIKAAWADATDTTALRKDMNPALCDTTALQKDLKAICPPSTDTTALRDDLKAGWADATDTTALREDLICIRKALLAGECTPDDDY